MPSFIYAIYDASNSLLYIGSTTRKYFCQRKGEHTRPSNSSTIKNLLEAHGGYAKCHFKILMECENLSKEQCLQKEKEFIEELMPFYNQSRPTMTHEEYLENCRIRQKRWRDANPEKAAQFREKARQQPSYLEKVKLRCSTIIECECGKTYTKQNKTNHFKSLYHREHEALTRDQISES